MNFKAINAIAALSALAVAGTSRVPLRSESKYKGRFRNNFAQKTEAMGKRVEKRRAKNKMARKARKAQRR